ncbi:amidohydrolase [Clostridium sp. 'deep sea']|uniref:amidohydrolase n=1 Tax=Clostridium sp. 'deep sea' TaxID=2779445 RepID=UPI00189674DD|nr:amidohydrolase [Clostridium sp. 'deep sea']QOR33993.1 amidohydrolase [Clostridium sp. 'deep sea']
MNKETLKQQVCKVIENHKDEIIAIGNDIFSHPELGYKEFRTADIVKRVFGDLGIQYRDKIGVTGVRADVKGRKSKLKVAVMGELDAVVCPDHPHADPQTGAAHSCGHNAQIAGMLGAAIGLVKSGVMSELDGDVSFMAVPAEEYVEIGYRQKLREEGKIQFLGGKQEWIALGELEDVDMLMMYHSASTEDGIKALVGGTSNGFVGKLVTYKGVEAHAGGAPHKGVNALNAAMVGMMAIHANRETFQDSDHIRVHPIITKGGDLVNIVPAEVVMETYVRGKSMDAIVDASAKVNRALKAGAMAVGAEVEITEIPGYLPRNNNALMGGLMKENLSTVLGDEAVTELNRHGAGSSDIGDIMHVIPAIHPYIGGVDGIAHSKHYEIVDEELAYVAGAKAMAMTVIDLLIDNAEKAEQVVENYKPIYNKDSYLEMWNNFFNAK